MIWALPRAYFFISDVQILVAVFPILSRNELAIWLRMVTNNPPLKGIKGMRDKRRNNFLIVRLNGSC